MMRFARQILGSGTRVTEKSILIEREHKSAGKHNKRRQEKKKKERQGQGQEGRGIFFAYMSSLRTLVVCFNLFRRIDIVTTGTILFGFSGSRTSAIATCRYRSLIKHPGLKPPRADITNAA
jgi:hypothetical protein